ncbi:MAG: aldo/keto reductase, partial [Planctomycetes bacterium]|nr:aldo/keto reductase [Planctomycetota bacterium]
MERRTLGRTGLEVSRLSLGGLFVSTLGGEFEQSKQAVFRAIELGINYIDTAPGYADSERVLGRILREVDTPLILSTKLGGRPEPFQPKNTSRLMQSVEESLRNLGRDHIDIMMIHEPDRPGLYDWWDNWHDFHGPVLELLDQLRADGTIGYTGLGGTTAYELPRIIRTGRFDVVLTAFNYSLLWREAEIEIFPAAIANDMGIIIGSPLQQGALARRYDPEVRNGAPWLSVPRRRQY